MQKQETGEIVPTRRERSASDGRQREDLVSRPAAHILLKGRRSRDFLLAKQHVIWCQSEACLCSTSLANEDVMENTHLIVASVGRWPVAFGSKHLGADQQGPVHAVGFGILCEITCMT